MIAAVVVVAMFIAVAIIPVVMLVVAVLMPAIIVPARAVVAIAIHRRVRIARHDDARSGMTQKGSDEPNLEVRGSDSLPLQTNRLERARSR